MASSTRERIVKLLGQNIQQSLVASAVGVTDSYISQLLTEEGVMEEIAHLKAAKLEEAVAQSDTIDDIKKLALSRISSTIAFAKSPLEAARVFQILDNAHRPNENPLGDSAGVQIVQITLPRAGNSTIRIQLNEQNQVIDVEGRSMAPLPSRVLPQLAAKVKQQAEDAKIKNLPVPVIQDAEQATNKIKTLPDITAIMDGVQIVL